MYLTAKASSEKCRKLSCNECGSIIIPTKLRIPDADASSCILITLSGLFRAHCHAGSGWTCIWQPRTPSCFGVFGDEKALLKHMLAVHFRDEGDDVGLKVDWPADVRRGDVEKCGFKVRMNGMQMRNLGGSLIVPRQTSAASRISESSVTSSARTSTTYVSSSRSSTTLVGSMETAPYRTGQTHEAVGERRSPPPAYVDEMPFEMGSSGTEHLHEMPSAERVELYS
jgi:hypothetical protein